MIRGLLLPDGLPEPDIITRQLQQDIAAGEAGEDPLTVPFPQVIEGKICGDDRGSPVIQTGVDAVVQLGRRETVVQLRAQIINDQKVAVQDIGDSGILLCVGQVPVKFLRL